MHGMDLQALPSTRKEATTQGLKHFFPNRRCKRDHLCAHRVDNGCMECAVLRKRKWRAENPEESVRRVTEYQARNKEKYQANKLAKHKLRRETDLAFNLKLRLRRRLNGAMQAAGTSASKSTLELLGCNPEELKQHIASQFRDSMTLENYGDWEVDHIRPCALFDLTDPEQQKACFHYTNLQPLWRDENRSKGARFIG